MKLIHIESIIRRYPVLESVRQDIIRARELVIDCYEKKGKLLICGNGGSSADADHIVGELMKGFIKKRPIPPEIKQKLIRISPEQGEKLAGSLQQALPAINLSAHTSLVTAFSNDVDADYGFAQQVAGYGKCGDVLLGISTSGNAKNVICAVITAKALSLKTIGLTGKNGGRLSELCDICIQVPAVTTPEIQELHLPVYHALCAELEEYFFDL